jgi:integrase
MGHSMYDPGAQRRRPWNAGRKLGAKRALRPREVWAIRFYLDREQRLRDRALFDLAIDSKLRGCDVIKIKIGDLLIGNQIRLRAIVVQQKTGRPVQFELLEPARASILAWLERRSGSADDFVFPSRVDHADHIGTRQYARLVDEWVNRDRVTPRRIRDALAAPSQKRPSSTSRQAIYGPSKFSSAIRKSRAPFVILAST